MCSWHFPNGKAAGPSWFAWDEGKILQYPDHLSHTPKQEKQAQEIPTSGEEEGFDQLHTADIATAQAPSTSKSLVVLEIENDMLREENEKFKKTIGETEAIFFLQSNFQKS